MAKKRKKITLMTDAELLASIDPQFPPRDTPPPKTSDGTSPYLPSLRFFTRLTELAKKDDDA